MNLWKKIIMVDNSAYRLADNIKKTRKRANALEEREREEFTRLKVIKRMKEKHGG